MAQFVSDTFTDTDDTLLQSHTGETGATWTHRALGTDYLEVKGNALRGAVATVSSTQIYTASGSPAGADYTVKGNIKLYGTGGSSSDSSGVCGRHDGLNDTSSSYYFAQYSIAAAGWRLFKRITVNNTQLGSTVSGSLADGDEIILRMSGTTIELYKKGEGSATISATDSAISAAGSAGVRLFTTDTTNAVGLDTFSADDIVSGGVIKRFLLLGVGA